MAISVSIIIPVYNKQSYLRACIESVLNQSYTDIEVVVVNDGSTDDSLRILQSFSDPRLKVYNVANGGVSRARNFGIEHASGQYLTFVDADDTLTPGFIEKFMDCVRQNNPDVLIGGLTKIFSDGHTKVVTPLLPPGEVSLDKFKARLLEENFSNEGIYGYVASKLVKASLINRFDLRFNPELKLAEDLDFWSRVYLKASSIEIVDNCGYLYLQQAENSSVTLTGQQHSQLDIWLSLLLAYGDFSAEGRTLLLRKLLGTAEALFLMTDKLSLSQTRKNLEIIGTKLMPIRPELKPLTATMLQRLILSRSVLPVHLYLTSRRLYHSLR